MNGSCRRCPAPYWTNDNHTACLPIIPTAVKLSDPAGISVGVVAALGVLGVVSITGVYVRNGNTHIVRASSKILSYLMLFGIFLGYMTAVLVLRERTEMLCQVVLFMFSIGFSIVVGTLLIKTNRIYRIFSKRPMRKGTSLKLNCSRSGSSGIFVTPVSWALVKPVTVKYRTENSSAKYPSKAATSSLWLNRLPVE